MRSFLISREFIEIESTLYEILRKIREDHGPVIEVWREHLGADKVFKKDGFLFFCRTVEEAQIVEETRSEERRVLFRSDQRRSRTRHRSLERTLGS